MKERQIYMISTNNMFEIMKGKSSNAFTCSEWNDLDVLPQDVITLLRMCKDEDSVFTLDNFMLCFNLEDRETNNETYFMFIPDKKFDKQIKKSIF